jgi:hypothetical protein
VHRSINFSERLKQHGTSMSLLFSPPRCCSNLHHVRAALHSDPDRSTLQSRPKEAKSYADFLLPDPQTLHTAKRRHGLVEPHSATPESAARFLSSTSVRGRYATAANPTPHHTTAELTLCLAHTGPSDAIIEKHAASICPFRRYY